MKEFKMQKYSLENILYKKGDKVKEIFYIDGPVYIVDEVDSQIVKTTCGKKLIKHGIRPVGYYDKWIKWSMSVKTL